MLRPFHVSRRQFLGSSLYVATAAMGLSSSSCSLIYGVHDLDSKFLVKPFGDNTAFKGWTEFEVGEDISSVNRANVLAVTLSLLDEQSGDLSFLVSVTGSMKDSAGQPVPVVAQDSFPRSESSVIMDILYKDDLKPLVNGGTIRIDWSGTTDPNFGWSQYPDGFWIRTQIKINVE